MSDALLTEISKKLSDIHAVLSKGGAAAAIPPKADKPATPKPETKKEAAPKAPKAGATAPAGTKAADGKHTIEEVRDILKKVAVHEALGRQVAINILDENGGVDHLTKLKPENYDAVYEAAQVELNGAKTAEPAGEDDDGLGL